MSRAKEAIIEEFKNYVSPLKVAVYKRMGIELVPGQRGWTEANNIANTMRGDELKTKVKR